MSQPNDSLDELKLLKEQLRAKEAELASVIEAGSACIQSFTQLLCKNEKEYQANIARLELSHAERLEEYFRGDLRLYSEESLPRLQYEVGTWGETTFPRSTIGTIQRHLVEESEELYDALHKWNALQAPVKDDVIWPSVLEEFADCFLILCHLAHRRGFSLLDILRSKFQSVQTRTWKWDEERGYYKHVPVDYPPEEEDSIENYGSQENQA